MDREVENQNEEADDFVRSPENAQSADENYEEIEDAEGTFPPSQMDEQDDDDEEAEAEFMVESSTQFHSGGVEMVEEGETLVEETAEPRMDEEAKDVVESSSKVVGTSKSLRAKPKLVKKSPALKKSSAIGAAEIATEPTTELNSGDGQMIGEGENLVEETNKSQICEEKDKKAEDLVDSSVKAEPRKKTTIKTLRVRSKIAKKASAGNITKKNSAIGTAEIATEPPTELNSAANEMIEKGENLAKETSEPQTDQQKNQEAEGVVEGSDKAGTSKTTTNSLRARPKIVKKTSVVKAKSAAGTAATGNKQVKVKTIKKKVVPAVNKENAQSANGVVIGLNAAENVDKKDIVAEVEPGEKDQVKTPEKELIVGESSKSQEGQKGNGNQTGTTGKRIRNRKNKRKIVGGAASQSVEKKKKLDTNDHADENSGKGKNIAKETQSNRDEKKKEELNDKGKKNGSATKNERLGGLIFMCSAKTRPDVFQYGVMGETIAKKDIVESIKPGLKLFLYDFERRVMHGIYEASSSGGMKLEPKAFSGSFPAQVRFRIYKECSPLPESTFKKAIKENYNKNKFDIKLSAHQVRKLITLFRPAAFSPLQSKKPQPAHPALPAARDREPPRSGIPAARDREPPRSGRGDRSERDAFAKPRDRSRRRDPAAKPKDSRSRQHPPTRRHERDLPIRSGELLPPPVQRRERPPPSRERDLYMSEREYRAYGLQSDRRNMSHLPRRSLEHERELERQRKHERERHVRHVEQPIYRDPLPVEPPYYARHQPVIDPYIPSARGGELHHGPSSAAAPPPSGFDSYARDSYYPTTAYNYGGAGPSPPPYLPSLRREDGLGYSSYPPIGREPDRVDPSRSAYTTSTLDGLSRYEDPRYYSEANAEAAVASRYAFPGPSSSSYSYR